MGNVGAGSCKQKFVISSFRALGTKKLKERQLYYSMFSLGQQPFNAGSPAGYSDQQQDWNGASALMARIEWAAALSSRFKSNAEQIMKDIFADTVSEHTYQMVLRAESRQQALTLLLMSPEFQRR